MKWYLYMHFFFGLEKKAIIRTIIYYNAESSKPLLKTLPNPFI